MVNKKVVLFLKYLQFNRMLVILVVKDLTSHCNILGDDVCTVKEITLLVKFSPKREKVQGSLTETVEGVKENETVSNKAKSFIYVQRTGRTGQSKVFSKYHHRKMSHRNFNQGSKLEDSQMSMSNDDL